MENLACQTLKKEIVEARERVFTKQREYEEKIGMKAPVELQKRVFNILFRVSQKLDSFDITKNLKDDGLDFLNPKLNKKSIIKQMESLIDMISKEYYYDIAEIIDGYVFSNFIHNDLWKAEEKYLEELSESIFVRQYIRKHKESKKVAELVFYYSSLKSIDYNKRYEEKYYKLLGIKNLLLEYERALKSLDKVKDVNLKRAVLSNIRDIMEKTELYEIE